MVTRFRRIRWRGVALLNLIGPIVLVLFARVQAADAPPAFDWNKNFSLSLSDRVRGEFVDWFSPQPGKAPSGAERYNFFGNQYRLGGKLNLPNVLVVAEMQYTTILNLPNDASPPVVTKGGNLGPGALYFFNSHERDQEEPFLKLGYLQLHDLPGLPNTAMTAGRFEYSDGLESALPKDPALAWLKRFRIGERLVGPFGFTHVTRSFDAGRIAYDSTLYNVTAWGGRPTQGGFEISANPELDIWLAGLAFTLKQLPQLPPSDGRLFYIFYDDERGDTATKVDNRPAAVIKADKKNIAIHTGGVDYVAVVDAGPGRADGLLWGVLQGGDWGEQDHLAWAYSVEGGYQFPTVFAAPWLRTGYTRSSGDDDPNDSHHRTFFQILPTARSYAQFPFFNMMNSGDFFTQAILKPHSRITVRTDYHWLQAVEGKDLWYSGGGATNATVFGFAGSPAGGKHQLAQLVDCGITINLFEQLTGYMYYGHSVGQGVVKNTFGGSSANYGYIELTYRY